LSLDRAVATFDVLDLRHALSKPNSGDFAIYCRLLCHQLWYFFQIGLGYQWEWINGIGEGRKAGRLLDLALTGTNQAALVRTNQCNRTENSGLLLWELC